MPNKKSTKAKLTALRRKQAQSKAYIKKMKLELKKLEKGLSNRLLAWHNM